jgi:creatinine amidohydrolase
MSDDSKPRQGILEEMTLPEVEAFDPEIVVVPLGSTEPHGPHLPYCPDTVALRQIAEEGTTLANKRGRRALCYPTLPIGLNVNFGWPFALSMTVPTYIAMLMDLCEQIEKQGVRRILLLNGHGGNTAAIQAFQRQWAHRGCGGMPGAEEHAFVCSASRRSPRHAEVVEHPSDHAGEAETLEVMAAAPHLVRHEKLNEFPFGRPAIDLLEDPRVYWVRPWHLHVPQAAGGETRTVTAENAAKLRELNVEWVAQMIEELCALPWSGRYPYR